MTREFVDISYVSISSYYATQADVRTVVPVTLYDVPNVGTRSILHA